MNGPRTSFSLAALLALTACEPPPAIPTQDRRQNVQTSRIDGEVLVQGAVRGNAIVTLFDADRPPPPTGSGRPIAFTIIPEAELFENAPAGYTGPFTAPFTFSLVPSGSYIIQGFIDADGCQPTATEGCRGPDFNPWTSVTGEPNKGDVGGAALVDPTAASRVLRRIEVGTDGPAVGVTVSFAANATATVPFDRPAFQLAAPLRFVPAEGPKIVELQRLPLLDGAVDQRGPAFVARYVDNNGDNVPDDADGDGQPDLWPRVLVRKLAANGFADENDLDRNGILDAEGEQYTHADGTSDEKPEAVILAATLERDELVSALQASGGFPVPVPRLRLVVLPRALDISNPGPPVPLQTVPSGRYAVTLVQFTGQTWRVPNELAPGPIAQAFHLPEIESQSFVVEVP